MYIKDDSCQNCFTNTITQRNMKSNSNHCLRQQQQIHHPSCTLQSLRSKGTACILLSLPFSMPLASPLPPPLPLLFSRSPKPLLELSFSCKQCKASNVKTRFVYFSSKRLPLKIWLCKV
mmetsp:Transcript_18752/g.27497  ORF Transcript_18752/g.27497 Transcript_18752/m.27497 type:complete len:119 (+) Transcript_18752:421-777(+)